MATTRPPTPPQIHVWIRQISPRFVPLSRALSGSTRRMMAGSRQRAITLRRAASRRCQRNAQRCAVSAVSGAIVISAVVGSQGY
jgi:hypothetical protein